MQHLKALSLVVFMIGWIWLMIKAMDDGVLTFFMVLFIPLYALFFGWSHYDKLKTPTLMYGIGLLADLSLIYIV